MFGSDDAEALIVPPDADAFEAGTIILRALGQDCGRDRCECQRSITKGTGVGLTHCPVEGHADTKPSFSVGPHRNGKLVVHCQGGCAQDDVIAALKAKRLWPSRPAPPKLAVDYAELLPDPDTLRELEHAYGSAPPPAVPPFAYQRRHRDPVAHAWSMWEHKTGIPREFWEEYGWTYDPGGQKFIIAYHGRDVWRYRTWPPKADLKYFWEKKSRTYPPLWPVPADDPVQHDALICAGETDAGTMHFCGYRAYAVTKGENTPLDRYAITGLAELGVERLLFLFDLDSAGEIGAHRNAAVCAESGMPCAVLSWPMRLKLEGMKDANDMWHATGRNKPAFRRVVDALIQKAVPWTPEQMPAHVRERLERDQRPPAASGYIGSYRPLPFRSAPKPVALPNPIRITRSDFRDDDERRSAIG